MFKSDEYENYVKAKAHIHLITKEYAKNSSQSMSKCRRTKFGHKIWKDKQMDRPTIRPKTDSNIPHLTLCL